MERKVSFPIQEEFDVYVLLKKLAADEQVSLALLYRRAMRLYLSTLPESGNIPQEKATS